MTVVAWSEFARNAPELAEAGTRLLVQGGVAIGFLAAPRVQDGPTNR